MEKTFELAPQTRKATFQPPSVNADKRTIDLTWSTGAAVRRFSWERFEVVNEELSLEKNAVRMERLNGGAPFLNSHAAYDLEDVLGVVERAWIDGEAKATVRFHDDSTDKEPTVEPIWRKVVNGIIRNVSVGYIVHQYRDVTKKGDPMPTLLAIDWEPLELSAVAIGADRGAGFRSQQLMTTCRVISEGTEFIDLTDQRATEPALIEEPVFDLASVRFVGADGKELSPDQIQAFMRQQAAKQIPVEPLALPDYRALRARLELLKVA